MTPTHQTIDVTTLAVRHTEAPARTWPDDLEQIAASWPERAQAITISNQESYDAAVELARAVKGLRGEAEAHHRPMIAAAYASHQASLAGLRKIDDPLARAEAMIKSKLATWTMQQECIRQAEAERVRQVEAKRQAEELERELEAIEAAGAAPAEVAAIIQEAERTVVVTPILPPTYARAAGITSTKKWSANVVDMAAFVKFITGNTQYLSLLTVNQSALNQQAKISQNRLNIPGVQVSDGITVGIRK